MWFLGAVKQRAQLEGEDTVIAFRRDWGMYLVIYCALLIYIYLLLSRIFSTYKKFYNNTVLENVMSKTISIPTSVSVTSTSRSRYGDFRLLDENDVEKAARTFLDAFSHDELSAYLTAHILSPALVEKCHLALYEAYLRQHMSHGIVIGTNEDDMSFETVAVWATPESEEDGLEDFATMCEAGYNKVWDLYGPGGRDKIFRGLLPLLHGAAHRILGSDSRISDKDVYTLVYVGSTAKAQGKGNLRKMFNYMFDKYIDVSDNTISYLESSAASNIPIYNRFGFGEVESITLGEKTKDAQVGIHYAVLTIMIRGNRGIDWTTQPCDTRVKL